MSPSFSFDIMSIKLISSNYFRVLMLCITKVIGVFSCCPKFVKLLVNCDSNVTELCVLSNQACS